MGMLLASRSTWRDACVLDAQDWGSADPVDL